LTVTERTARLGPWRTVSPSRPIDRSTRIRPFLARPTA
jgi:hypothetical protein